MLFKALQELLQRLSVHSLHISIRGELGFICSLTGMVTNEDTINEEMKIKEVVPFYHTAINAWL